MCKDTTSSLAELDHVTTVGKTAIHRAHGGFSGFKLVIIIVKLKAIMLDWKLLHFEQSGDLLVWYNYT